MFLVGPLRQVKNMFAGTRIIATIVYLGAMALTLFAAFYVRRLTREEKDKKEGE